MSANMAVQSITGAESAKRICLGIDLGRAPTAALSLSSKGYTGSTMTVSSLHRGRTVSPAAALAVVLALLVPSAARAEIFVDNAATGCANGDSTYEPATRSCSAGSDTVYVEWSAAADAVAPGTAGEPTVVYVRSGTYLESVFMGRAWTSWQKYSADPTKPLVDGEWIRPGGPWNALIFVAADAEGVTIDGIEVARAGPLGGQGVGAIWTQAPGTTVRNCYIHDTTDTAITLEYGADWLVEDNEIYEAGVCMLENACSSWGGAITIHDSPGPTVIRRNLLHGVGGEGIHPIRGAENVTIEHNVVFDVFRPGIYVHSSRDITIRYNLVYCTMDPRYALWGGSCGPGIRIAAEEYGDGWNTNEYVYGNLVAGTSIPFSIAEIWPDASTPTNIRVFNNTFVEANSTEGSHTTLFIQEDRFSDTNQIENNIFWQSDGNPIATVPPGGATFANNLWSTVPDPDAQSSTDSTYPDYPMLSLDDYLEKTSGWFELASGDLAGEDFALRATAVAAIDQGQDLGPPYDVDFFGTSRPQGAAWDIGAHERCPNGCGGAAGEAGAAGAAGSPSGGSGGELPAAGSGALVAAPEADSSCGCRLRGEADREAWPLVPWLPWLAWQRRKRMAPRAGPVRVHRHS
jgi:parallel beta-helix repeat protein